VEEGRDRNSGRTCDSREDGDFVVHQGHGFHKREQAAGGDLGSTLKWYVSYYFTNFSAQLSIFYLRKGFEVCGILEDVYVARKRNRLGEPYGFVKFSNVRDVDKMTKALNAVWFGQFRVRASVAKFDRNAPGAERRVEEKQVSLSKGVREKQDGHKTITRQATSQGGDLTTKQKEAEPVGGSTGTLDSEKEGSGVHVGDIVLNLENFKRQDVQSDGVQHLKKHVPKDSALPSEAAKGKEVVVCSCVTTDQSRRIRNGPTKA
jgi:hypothetical protein